MNKSFNRVRTLKSSGNCDKYSKSVSYETLVGGTATNGTEHEQKQRLIKSSAVKPLTAVGTLTSLLCNSAKVVEKLLRHVITRRTSVRRGYLPEKCTHANKESLFASVTCFMRFPRRIQRMLLVMTIPALALALLFAFNISPSFAAQTCDCGDDCCWEFDSSTGKLTITGSGAMNDYDDWNKAEVDDDVDYFPDVPWNDYRKAITSVDIGDGITSVGGGTFMGYGNLKSVTGMNDVKTIGGEAFNGASSLERVDMPSVKTIGDSAFNGASSLESVTMPNVEEIYNMAFQSTSLSGIDLPNLKKVGDMAFHGTNIQYVNLPDDVEYCYSVSNCGYSLYEEGNFYGGLFSSDEPVAKLYKSGKCTTSGGKVTCGSCGNDYAMSGKGCVSDCGAGMLGKNGKCVSASEGCGAGYRQFENFCNRIQYTPAEAAAVLHNDNTNSVTITFKK